MLVGTLAYSSLGIDFLGDDYLASAFTTMNSEWLQNHPESWGKTITSDGFPILENPYPDYDGVSSWDEYGPELFLRFYFMGENGENETRRYLVKGAAWDILDPDSELAESLEGAYYDSSSNTLTLENFSCYKIETNVMGNGFTIDLKGENRIGSINIWGAGYGGSVTFEGDGILMTNTIELEAENSNSCVMIRRGVTIEIGAYDGTGKEGYGRLAVYGTLMSKQLWLADGVRIFNGHEESEVYEHEDHPKFYTYSLYQEEPSENAPNSPIIIRTED